jgi:hypothetical protein
MKKYHLFLLVAFLSVSSSALFSQPVKIEVYGDQVLEKSYLGNGVQWSAYPQIDISEKSWQRVFERTDFMKLNFIRLVLNANEYCQTYPANGKPVYNFNADKIIRVCRILDYCQKQGVDVILGEWSPPRMDGMSVTDPRWSEIVCEFINYLVNVKKYSCIKYYNLGNEPNGRDGYVELWKKGSTVNYDNWRISILNFNKELVKRGLRESIKIVGPDCSNGNDWLKKIIDDKELAAAIDVYEVHSYARDKEIEDGMYGKEMAYYRDYISYRDPNGKNKKFFMGEAGMITGRNNVDQQKMIGTFQYGVWMTDYVIQSMNAGQAGLIAWDLDDAMHTNGKLGPGTDIKDYIWKEWGFWDSFGEEKGKPELTYLRPWYYTWSLLSKYVPRGSQVLKTSNSGIAGLRSAASIIIIDTKTEYTFIIVNESTEKRTVNLVLSGVKGIDLNQFNYFENDMPVDAKGFAVAKKVLKNATLSKGIPVELPSKGAVILTSLN